MKHIFISSTFRDMQAERDLVQERVLPELKEKARKYGENVGVIDLRWGVDTSELETDEGSRKVLSVCLEEIERSHPYMLIFMGERYGWIPDPGMIKTAVQEKAEKIALDDYEKSITALEIEFGALSETYGELDKCVVCFRSPLAHLITEEAERKVYLEENPKAVQKLQKLQNRMRQRLGDRIIEYTADWDAAGKRFDNFRTVQGEALENAVSKAYLKLFEKDWEAYARLSWQEREQLEVQAVMESKLRTFRGREKLLADYRGQLEKNYVLILKGAVGSGKTSLMCRLMQELKDEGQRVFRFISGNTLRSSSAFDLLKQIVWFMEETFGIEEHFDAEETSGYDDWKEYLDSLCNRIPDGEKVYLCVDALDQLQTDEHVEKLDFLPGEHEKVHIIASCTTEFVLPVAFEREGRTVAEVSLLSVEDAMEVIEGLSAGNSRNVYESIRTAMLKKADAGNPLYLSFLMQRLNMMDQEELREAVNEQEIVAAGVRIIEGVPDNLEAAAVHVMEEAIERLTEERAGLKEILNFLAVSRNGLRAEDLSSLLEKQGKAYQVLDMTRLMKYLEGFFVMYSDGRIDFGHKVIRKGLRTRVSNMTSYQGRIMDYLKGLQTDDILRNREGMYFARELKDRAFAVELISEAGEKKNRELQLAISAEALEDEGKFYCDILGGLSGDIGKAERENIITFFLFDFKELLDISAREIKTKQNIFSALTGCCEQIHREEGSLGSLRDLAVCNYKMGGLYKSIKQYGKSEAYYKKTFEYFALIHTYAKSDSSSRELTILYKELDAICTLQGKSSTPYKERYEQYINN